MKNIMIIVSILFYNIFIIRKIRFKKLILCGESDMDADKFIKFKNEFLKNGIENIIDRIITNHKMNENIINTYKYIQSLLNE